MIAQEFYDFHDIIKDNEELLVVLKGVYVVDDPRNNSSGDERSSGIDTSRHGRQIDIDETRTLYPVSCIGLVN